MKIIGLGKAGCNIAKAFSKFPQYDTFGIDTHKGADITIKKRSSHQDYDAHFPNLARKLKFTNSRVCVVTSGAGQISGGLLQLLKQLKNNHVTVIYIQPDLVLLSENQQLQEKIVRNVVQEYARSGMIEAVWLINNQLVERGVGHIPIMGYYDILNQAIVNTLHMLNVFRNSEPVLGNFIDPHHLSRIVTVGIVDIEEGKEKWFYDLTQVRDVVYYYGIHEEQLKEDGTLFRKITDYVKSRIDDGVNISYGVFKTTYDQKYCYCIKYSSVVQSYITLLDG